MFAVLVSIALGMCRSSLSQSDHCGPATEAFSSADWQAMKPAHLPVEVKFTNAVGWVGLGHVFGTQERAHARWRAAVPFLVPTVVQPFPDSGSEASVNNQNPVFYIQATEIASLYPTFDSDNIRLLRFRAKQDRREIPVSKGITTFTFKPAIPSQFLVPISITRLSETVIELKPRNPLTPGQYLITIGPQQKDGFEFEMKCSGKPVDDQ